MDNGWVLTFLIMNAVLVGVLAMLAIHQARAHYRPVKTPQHTAYKPTIHLPPELREQLIEKAERDFKTVISQTAHQLQQEQLGLVNQLNERVGKLGNSIVDDEMKRYRAKIDELRMRAEKLMATAYTETEQHQNQISAELEKQRAQIEEQMRISAENEKQKLARDLDTKLADAISAFLTETLRHNVDLGEQQDFLVAMIEEHKEELTKGIINES